MQRSCVVYLIDNIALLITEYYGIDLNWDKLKYSLNDNQLYIILRFYKFILLLGF